MTDPTEHKPFWVKPAAPFMWCLNHATTSLNALGTLLIIALMALICADVIGRNLLKASVPGVIELAEMGIVAIVFLQIGDTLKAGKLMRSDGIITLLSTRLPRFAEVLNMLFDLTGAVLFYFIATGGYKRFRDAYEGDFYIGNQGEFTAPTWPMELIVATGSALVGLLFLTSGIRRLMVLFAVLPAQQEAHEKSEFEETADQ